MMKSVMTKLLTGLFATASCLSVAVAEPKKIVFISHLSSHGNGQHEYAAGCRLIGQWLEKAYGDQVTWEHHINWPEDPEKAFDGAATVVFFCSGGGGHLVNPHVKEFDAVMRKGVGLACLHYAVEVPLGPAGKGMLRWMGGYFETHWSVNPHWVPKFESFPEHPVANGLAPFEIDDEWYFHMRFVSDSDPGLTPILSAPAPASTMERGDGPHSGNPHVREAVTAGIPQPVAWTYQRGEDYGKGRGFGFTGLHYHKNFQNDAFRRTVLNGVAWTAGLEIPEDGVESPKPTEEDLERSMVEAGAVKEAENADEKKNGSRQKQAERTPEKDGLKPVYASNPVTVSTPGHAVAVEADITGARELYLVVTDAGDGFACDWADWIEPRLSGPEGELKLTDRKWKKASSQWGHVAMGRNAGGGALEVDGVPQTYGIGTHANSLIAFDIPEGSYTKFHAKGALDTGGTSQGDAPSVQFFVYTEDPSKALPLATASSGGGEASRDPQDALASLDVHPELRAQLFASEPHLLSPSSIDVDHRGRVWVCEVINYRGHRGKRSEGDRIVILEDMDGDGQADTSKVFYQGTDVDSAHGICVLGDRVLVSAGEEVFYLIDDDGDDKADDKELLFTNIGGSQHDHGTHAFMFGPDGRLYFNFGNAAQRLCDREGKVIVDLAGNKVEANRNPYQQGMVFRCEMDGSQVETLGWNFRNNWEAAVDSFGTIWQSDNDDDGNQGVRINYVMEFGNYGYQDEMSGAGWRDERIGMHEEIPLRHWHLRDPGVVPNMLQTGAGSPSGLTVYEGDLLPSLFHGQVLHCDPGPNVCRAYITTPDGAGYRAEIVDLLSSTKDRWYRPSDVCVAPDGSLIIADWYDPGVGGHGMGDLERGRLFRLAPEGKAYGIEPGDLSGMDGAMAAFKSPNNARRYLGWKALRAHGSKAVEALKTMARAKDEQPHQRARALFWLGHADVNWAIDTALADGHPRVRMASLRLARQHYPARVVELVSRLADDGDARVRRDAAIALRFKRGARANELWAKLAGQHDGEDRWYLEALGIGADLHWDERLAALLTKSGVSLEQSAIRDIVWRSRASDTAELLAGLLTTLDLEDRERDSLLRAFHFLPANEAREKALLTLFAEGSVPAQIAAVSYLDPGVIRDDEARMKKAEALLGKLKGTPPFVRLADRLGFEGVEKELLSFVANHPDSDQLMTATRLLLRSPDTVAKEIVEGNAALQRALGAMGEETSVEILVNTMSRSDLELERRRELAASLAMSSRGERKLLQLAEEGQLTQNLEFAVAAVLSRSRDREIREKITEVLKLPTAVGTANFPPLDQLLRMDGKPDQGRAAFVKATCNTCHVVDGAGIDFGPDLSEIGNKLAKAGMLEAILYPNNAISHGFQGVVVTMENEDAFGGYVVSESPQTLSLRLPGGVMRELAKAEIAKRENLEHSLMPAGLVAILGPEGLADLVAYLETLK